jgi:hypothetical protein
VIAALEGEPERWFTIEELAELAYPGEAVAHKHASSVRRALKSLPDLKVRRQREGRYGARGWRHFVSLSRKPKPWG